MATDSSATFISYSRADSEFALKLAEDLKSAGANVWLDQLDIEPGALWDRAVEDALFKCPAMLVILSSVSANSENVRDEVSYALSRQKRVIPVLYRECDIPFRLARLQRIDFTTDYVRGLKVLLNTLKVEPKATEPNPTPVQTKEIEPPNAAPPSPNLTELRDQIEPEIPKPVAVEVPPQSAQPDSIYLPVDLMSETPAEPIPETPASPPRPLSAAEELSPPASSQVHDVPSEIPPYETVVQDTTPSVTASTLEGATTSWKQVQSPALPRSPILQVLVAALGAGIISALGSSLLWNMLHAMMNEGYSPWTPAKYSFNTVMTGCALAATLLWLKPDFKRHHALLIVAVWLVLGLIEFKLVRKPDDYTAYDIPDLDYMWLNDTKSWFLEGLRPFQWIMAIFNGSAGLITGVVLAFILKKRPWQGMLIGLLSFAVLSFLELRFCFWLERIYYSDESYHDPYFAITNLVLLVSAFIKIGAFLWFTRDWGTARTQTQESVVLP